MTTIIDFDIMMPPDPTQVGLWGHTKNIAASAKDIISEALAYAKTKITNTRDRVGRFLDRHLTIKGLLQGTAIISWFMFVFVTVTVVMTYMLLFAFMWTETIFGF
jgi:hypothetical protein